MSARLCRALGIDGRHVAYRDSLLPDLIAGRIGFAVMPTPAALREQAARINGWLADSQRQPEIAARYAEAAIEPMPLDLEQTRQAVTERLRLVDAMRSETFGRGRAG